MTHDLMLNGTWKLIGKRIKTAVNLCNEMDVCPWPKRLHMHIKMRIYNVVPTEAVSYQRISQSINVNSIINEDDVDIPFKCRKTETMTMDEFMMWLSIFDRYIIYVYMNEWMKLPCPSFSFYRHCLVKMYVVWNRQDKNLTCNIINGNNAEQSGCNLLVLFVLFLVLSE